MKSTHSQPRLDCSIETGWTIHIYNRQRQLLCTLDPSHGWAVATGMVIWIAVSCGWLQSLNAPNLQFPR